MQNWTDKIIHWNQLPGTEVKRLLATWGKTPAEIAKYDKKHGFENSAPKSQVPVTAEKPTKPAAKPAAKKTAAKPAARQKHTGADGAIKFVAHRNLYVGFMGGKVVVTKRTVDACRAVLLEQFGIEGVQVDA
jgi:anti-sigma factor RsiW